MAVFRVHKTKDFTVMSNHHLRDKNLTLKAKGLLSVILSLPDDWKYSIAGLASICKEGTSAVKSALQELTDAGYVTVTKLYPNQTETGRIEYVYDIHETPQAPRKQGVENLPLEHQQVENHCQLSTEKQSTDNQTTKEEKKEEIPYAEIIDYLNEVTGKRYKPTAKKARELISARWSEDYKLEDFKKVIDNMHVRWKGTKFEQYLQPSTLFAQSHFDEYLNKPAYQPNQDKDDRRTQYTEQQNIEFDMYAWDADEIERA